MRSCDEMTGLISAALDGELTDDERRELNDHLASCPACGALFAELSGLNEAVGALETAPEGFSGQVMARIRAESAPAEDPGIPLPVKRHRFIPWKSWAATAAVVAVVILGISVLPGRIGFSSSDGSLGSGNGSTDAQAPGSAADMVGMENLPQTIEKSSESPAEFDPADALQDAYIPSPGSAQPPSNAETDQPEAPSSAQQPAATFLPPEDTKPIIGVGGDAHFCGVLILTGDLLPEELEKFDAATDEDGHLTYTVPADAFFAITAELEAQNGSGYTYRHLDAEADPAAEYGLIIVEEPSE